MSEIKLPKLCPLNEIEGKTISKINERTFDSDALIVLFTDNTYLYVDSVASYVTGCELIINDTEDDVSCVDYGLVLKCAGVPIELIQKMSDEYHKKLREQGEKKREELERAEYERLKAKYGNQPDTTNGASNE